MCSYFFYDSLSHHVIIEDRLMGKGGSKKKSPFFLSSSRSKLAKVSPFFTNSCSGHDVAVDILRKFRLKQRNRQNSIGSGNICSICLEMCTDECMPNSCKHSFCFLCIIEWGKVSSHCPLCKKSFSLISGKYNPSLHKIIETLPKQLDDSFDFVGTGDDSDEYEVDVDREEYDYGYEFDDFVVPDDFLEFE